MTLTSIAEEATTDRSQEIEQRLEDLREHLSEIRYGHVVGMTKLIRRHGPAADLAAITYLNATMRNPAIADPTEHSENAIYACKACLSGNGMLMVDEERRVFRPCDICRPMTYATWLEGHSCCRHRDDCATCIRIMQTHAPDQIATPVYGRKDDNVRDFLT